MIELYRLCKFDEYPTQFWFNRLETDQAFPFPMFALQSGLKAIMYVTKTDQMNNISMVHTVQ